MTAEHGEPVEFEWTRKRHDIRQAAKRFLEGDETMATERIDMIRKSEYDELVREHLETRAEIVRLEAKLHEQIEWRKQAIQGWSKENDEIEQLLGKVLGYPWFKDDLKNFPDATESDGVCVGEHVPATLAAEAATKIKVLQDKLQATETALIKANTQETELYVENGRMRVLLQELRPGVERDATYAAHRLAGAADYPVADEAKYIKMSQDAEALLERIDAEIGTAK